MRLIFLRDRLKNGLFGALDDVYLNGHPTKRLPGHLNLSFAGIEGESLLFGLQDIALSTTSACSSGSTSPSHVLRALGFPDSLARAPVRSRIALLNTSDYLHLS